MLSTALAEVMAAGPLADGPGVTASMHAKRCVDDLAERSQHLAVLMDRDHGVSLTA